MSTTLATLTVTVELDDVGALNTYVVPEVPEGAKMSLALLEAATAAIVRELQLQTALVGHRAAFHEINAEVQEQVRAQQQAQAREASRLAVVSNLGPQVVSPDLLRNLRGQ